MKIKALESMDFSVKGYDTVLLRAGEEIDDVPDEIAVRIIGHGFAEEALEGDGGQEAGVDDQGDGDEADTVDDDSDSPETDESGWPEGLTSKAEEALEGDGLTPDDIAGTSDEALLAITGIGPATVKLLREVFGPPPE